MRKERKNLPLASLLLNEGQLSWLPRNPRTWTRDDIKRTAASIREDPDFLEDRPLLVVAFGDKWVVFAGNLRHEGASEEKMESVPCVIYTPATKKDKETIIRRAAKDNGSFGKWDWDELANNPVWNSMRLADFGIPVWDADAAANSPDMSNGLSSDGMEKGEGYEEFVDKFKPKLTTDDCFTPPAVYDAVVKFVDEQVTPLKGRKIVRPFFPGGNYEDLNQYPKGSIVIDNPPFSILAKIIRFYCAKGIDFWLFGPALTLFTAKDCDLTYIIASANIEYENGAQVSTGFITNTIKDLRVWCCPELMEAIDTAQNMEDKTLKGFVYPDNIVTAATLGKLTARHTELKIRKTSCEAITDSDSAKEQGRVLYGGGFILSDRAAAERAAAERAARLKAEATKLHISDRERKIIERLNKQDK